MRYHQLDNEVKVLSKEGVSAEKRKKVGVKNVIVVLRMKEKNI